MKRLASFVLSFILLFAIAIPAFASGGGGGPTKSPLAEKIQELPFESLPQTLKNLDKDPKDGALSDEELAPKSPLIEAIKETSFQNLPESFQALDVDGSGELSDSELSPKGDPRTCGYASPTPRLRCCSRRCVRWPKRCS